MLVSTKALTDDELVEQDKNRDTFKQAIGLKVSSPVEVGADSKMETTRGSDQNIDRSYKDSSNCVVFEAVGGNTILASNPSQWCPTVGNHVNWRVIE
ncbi:membrane attack complex component perforin, partial [Colletotrichum tofieldiae]